VKEDVTFLGRKRVVSLLSDGTGDVKLMKAVEIA